MKNPTAQDTFKRLQRVPLDIGFVDFDSVEMENVSMHDYPDFCDACVSYAAFKNGVELNDDQIEELNENSDIVYDAVMSYWY